MTLQSTGAFLMVLSHDNPRRREYVHRPFLEVTSETQKGEGEEAVRSVSTGGGVGTIYVYCRCQREAFQAGLHQE